MEYKLDPIAQKALEEALRKEAEEFLKKYEKKENHPTLADIWPHTRMFEQDD